MRLDCPDTLRYFLEVPQRQPLNLGAALTAADIRKAVSQTKAEHEAYSSHGGGCYANPNLDAAHFYATNQMVAALQAQFQPDDPLPPWAQELVQEYVDTLAIQNLRMFHYILLICTREARHIYGTSWFDNHAGSYPAKFHQFFQMIKGSGSDSAVHHFISNAPEVPLDVYCAGMTSMFNSGSWGSGYGGKKWGKIAKTLAQYTSGETSGEVFVDTGYTLAHNNGPIFNKGMYYHMYNPELLHILDVQRSGQVVEMVNEGFFSEFMSTGGPLIVKQHLRLKELCKKAAMHLEAVGPYVDWFKVEELGALKSYTTYKNQQLKKYGHVVGKKPEKVAQPTLYMGKPAKVVGVFEVLPGQAAHIMERVPA